MKVINEFGIKISKNHYNLKIITVNACKLKNFEQRSKYSDVNLPGEPFFAPQAKNSVFYVNNAPQ